MIGNSLREWILIRAFIIFFRFTPLLYAVILLCLQVGFGSRVWSYTAARITLGLLGAEGLFYALVYRPFLHKINDPRDIPAEPLDAGKRKELFTRCLDNVSSPEAYIQGWFLGSPLKDIRKENLREFLYWGFFDVDYNTRNPASDEDEARLKEVDGYIKQLLEGLLHHKFEEGRGPAKSLRLTIDEVHATYRSLLWYGIIFVLDQITHFAFWWHGFAYFRHSSRSVSHIFPPRPQTLISSRCSPAKDLSYWYRPHESSERHPLVYFHGIGVGLWGYVRFLATLCYDGSEIRKGNAGLIAVEVLPVSFRLTGPPLGKAEFVRQFTQIVDNHRWKEFAVVSHSYGSTLTTHVLMDPVLGPRIPSVVLIDPVTILLHLPDVAYNFTRRQPSKANEWQLWYFASTDPSVAHCLGRHFAWRDNIVWEDGLVSRGRGNHGETISRRVAVCLSGQDLIVNAASVAAYLLGSNSSRKGEGAAEKIQVLLFDSLDHAQVFDSPADLERVVRHIRSITAASTLSKRCV